MFLNRRALFVEFFDRVICRYMKQACLFEWVDSPEKVVAAARELKKESMVALDTEFIRETTFFPVIALIQIATKERCWLIDPVQLGRSELEPLFQVLVDQTIQKAMHAAYGDQECFYYKYGFVVSPVVDTSVAAALTGYGDNVGLARLLKAVIGVSLPKGRSRVHWLSRPLASELLDYAAKDVVHLVALAEKMLEFAERLGRKDWLVEVSRVQAEALDRSSESVAARMVHASSEGDSTLGCLYELALWREQRARQCDRPRGWVADNSVLMALARSQPRKLEELSQFRGLTRKEIEQSGSQILQAVERGKARLIEKNSLLADPPSEDEEQVVSLLKSFVAILSNKHRIAARLILPSDQMLALIRGVGQGTAYWVDQKVLTSQAARLVGGDLERFLSGRFALAVERGQLVVIEK